jgi:predicted nucleic acid-binding protein
MRHVFIDSAPVIYFVEDTPQVGKPTRERISRWASDGTRFVTSVITLCEVLVHPRRTGDKATEVAYLTFLENLLDEPPVSLDRPTAELAADLRARHGVRTPDALQLASALRLGCDTFFTNDHQLRRVGGIEIVLAAEAPSVPQ